MQTRYNKLFILGFILFACAVKSFSQSAQTVNIVTTAVPFLRISPDARAGGLGDQGIATSPDVNAQFYNVAKYPFIQTSWGIGATYTPW